MMPMQSASKRSEILDVDFIGDFHPHETKTANVRLTNNTNSRARLKIIVGISNAQVTNYTIFSSQYSYYEPNERKLFHVNINNDYFTESGQSLIFNIYKDNDIDFVKRVTYYPNAPLRINLDDGKGPSYYAYPAYFEIKDNQVYTYSDNFDFQYLQTHLVSETYQTFPFNDIFFYYKSHKPETQIVSNLRFVDKYDAFKDLRISPHTNQVVIPLKWDKRNYFIYPKLANSIYVSPKTFESSLMKKPGYVATNQLYLPINKYRDVSSYEFNIEMSHMGMSNSSAKINFTYERIKNIIGDCANSNYCIVAGKDNV